MKSVSLENFLGLGNIRGIAIKTNNYCNLHCEFCTNYCDIPLNKTNENIFRRTKWELSLDDLELFCERFKGIGEGNYHILTGAETTTMPVEKIHDIINMLYSYGRTMKLRTNCFNLLELDPNYLRKIYKIYLADHNINSELIDECHKYLRNLSISKSAIVIEHTHTHYNLREIRGHPYTLGKHCEIWMRDLELIGKIIYPCCNMPWLMAGNNDIRIQNELKRVGWTTENEDVVEVVRNWRKSIPEYVVDQCLNHCFLPLPEDAKKVKITRKPHDKIRRHEM